MENVADKGRMQRGGNILLSSVTAPDLEILELNLAHGTKMKWESISIFSLHPVQWVPFIETQLELGKRVAKTADFAL